MSLQAQSVGKKIVARQMVWAQPLRDISQLENVKVGISPGGIIAVAWIKIYATVYVLKRSIYRTTNLKIFLATIV